MSRAFCSLCLLLVALLLSGCPAPECAGAAGCPCDQEKRCDTGLSCEAGRCTAPGEPQQETPEETPGESDAGTQEPQPKCDAGTQGCRCSAVGACDSGLKCVNDICQSCPTGQAGCACTSAGNCEPGLRCEAGLCAGCEGKAQCACYTNQSCDKGLRCQTSSDGQSTCMPCGDKGTRDCQCSSDNDCEKALVCVHFRCQEKASLEKLPTSPKCYSPCEGNTRESDGSTRTCHPKHKLQEGCLPGQTCDGGSCIADAKVGKLTQQEYPYCATSSQCPSWQTCIAGRCYSNCDTDSACPSGFVCHAYVCRKRCERKEDNACSADETCQNIGTTDEQGLCLPTVSRRFGADKNTKIQPTFVLNTREFALSNLTPSGVFSITNKNAFAIDLKLSRSSDTTGAAKPLSWLRFDLCKSYESDGQCKAFADRPTAQEPYAFQLPAGKTIVLKLLGAEKSGKSDYQGLLRVASDQVEQRLTIQYRSTAQGRWKGHIYSFGNFDDTEIDKFPASSSLPIRSIKNALLRRWINVKRNEISFEAFLAILQSIQDRTWSQQRVANDCRKLFSTSASKDVACYPYSSQRGYEILSNSIREAPVPSGVTSLAFAMDVKPASGSHWQGRITTAETLQYPGNPEINIRFDGSSGVAKMSFLRSLDAVADVGGRYYVKRDASCANSDFLKVTLPWLLTDFTLSSEPRAGSLLRERFGCRAQNAPRSVPSGASKEQREQILAANASLNAANPIPNGRKIRRKLSLVDGVLYDNRIFFAIVRESMTSPFTTQGSQALSQPWTRYGYLLLRYVQADLTAADYQGSKASSCGSCPQGETCEDGLCQPQDKSQQVSCDPAIVKAAVNQTITSFGQLRSWRSQQLDDLVAALLGQQPASTASDKTLHVEKATNAGGGIEYSYQQSGQKRFIHYLCEDTKQFNGGPLNDPQDCPVSSKVVFFENTMDENAIRSHSCNTTTPPSCDAALNQLRTTAEFRENIPFTCVDASKAYCETNRKDMREGKRFYRKSTSSTAFVSSLSPLRNALFEAFRYRIKFRSRTGQNIGFTPQLCSKVASSQTPYCYNPDVIEQLEQRVNCLEALFTDNSTSQLLSSATKATLKAFLQQAFSYSNRSVNGVIFTDPGFETLNAELKVMLGDEAFTRALTSRYDLANTNLIRFEGDQLEPNGVQLSGVVGYEMHNLYLSTQYYQTVLDRFFSQTDVFVTSLRSPSTAFLTAASVTSYMEKLLLAASRKARSWSQIAQKYHAINRGDLAKHVIERAYLSSYMEQVILTQLLHRLLSILDKSQIAALQQSIERIALTYHAALLEMQGRYQQVQSQLDLFGFPEGYIPFPALSRSAVAANPQDAFQTVLQIAKEKLTNAADKEQAALRSGRAFDTDAARFQSELVKLENSYGEQLIALCGQLKDGDRAVPAIPRYAHLYDNNAVSNPCGKLQGSYIFDAYAAMYRAANDVPALEQQYRHLLARIENEKERIKAVCDERFSLSKITWQYQDRIKDMLAGQGLLNVALQSTNRLSMGMLQIRLGQGCQQLFGAAKNTTECLGEKASTAARIGILVSQEAALTGLNIRVNDIKKELLTQQRQFAATRVVAQCNVCPPKNPNCTTQGVARIQSQNAIASMALEQTKLRLQLQIAEYNMRLALSRVQSLENRAKRLIQEYDSALASKINVTAAANDPNQRIYKNDAVIAAEQTFEEALKEAYRLTLLYEYHTSQTYERRGNLYLIRMVSSGDVDLETYISRLEQAYRDFEERAGKPSLRVLVLSLRDDILKLPRTKADGTPLGLQDRVAAFQQMLNDPKNHDEDGYLSISFPISVASQYSDVSPITYGHKVIYVEAEIKATERGDDVGRLYLRLAGTGMVREADDQLKYYALPPRTAVLNPYFNGHKTFAPSIYQNFRFQDRPLGNTQWRLMFNQVSETSNQDIARNSINDIILYIYYRDLSK